MLSREFELAWGEDCSKNKKIRAKVDSRIYAGKLEFPGDGLLHAGKNTLNLKNRASLPNKATVAVSPKILQLHL